MSVVAFEELINSSSSSSSSSIGSEKPYGFTALLLHGLLGRGDQLRDFAHSLASSLSTSFASEWRMVLVDLRNHGNSSGRQGLSPPHDMANAARDLANLVKSCNWAWPDVVIAHSMGGKVAFEYALGCARGDYGDSATLPKQLWILDCVPGKLKNRSFHEELEKAFQMLQTLPSSIPSQEWLVDHMVNLGFSKFIPEWISSNLEKSGEHLTFPFNADGALQMFTNSRNMDYWALLEHPPKGVEMVMVRIESRVMWDPDVVERLEGLAARKNDGSEGELVVHVVPRSGHWIYKDAPERLLEIMTPKMASLVQG